MVQVCNPFDKPFQQLLPNVRRINSLYDSGVLVHWKIQVVTGFRSILTDSGTVSKQPFRLQVIDSSASIVAGNMEWHHSHVFITIVLLHQVASDAKQTTGR